MKNFLNTIKILIVCLGLIRFFGDSLQVKMLDNIGFASGFSPLPLVFSDRPGVEDFAHSIVVNYKLKNGQRKERIFGREAFNRLKGPPTKSSVYAIALAYSTRFPKTLWFNTLRYGFCNQGPLAYSFKEDGLIDSVIVNIYHLVDTQKKWSLDFSCK